MSTWVSRLGELCYDHAMATSSSSINISNRKKLMEERNLRLLRELGSLAHNKQCFDCHQRGPTYVNMTIGSFVCTSCSGLLRGLNPPHRVKSISMAMFAPDEIEFLKSRGNEYCKRTWTGRYSGTKGPFDDGAISKDEQQTKDYLSLKYEKKRWYVSPSEAFKETPSNTPPPPSASKAIKQDSSSFSSSSSPTILRTNPHSDLFVRRGDVNKINIPLPNAAKAISMQSQKEEILFDPFDDDFSSIQMSHQDLFQKLPKSATVPCGFLGQPNTNGHQPTQLEPIVPIGINGKDQAKIAGGQGLVTDKYSALAELDELFHSSSSLACIEVTKNGYADTKPSNNPPFSHQPPPKLIQYSSSQSANNFNSIVQPNFDPMIKPQPSIISNPFSDYGTQWPARQQQYHHSGSYAINGNAGFSQLTNRSHQNVGNQFNNGQSQYGQSMNMNIRINPFSASTIQRPSATSQWNPFL